MFHPPVSADNPPRPLIGTTARSAADECASRVQHLERVESQYPRAMPLAELAFLIGPLSGMILGPIALITVVIQALRKHLAWALWTGVTLMFVLVVCTEIYWTVWGRAFNYADSGRAVPARLELASSLTMSAAAFACVCLLISAVVVGRSRPR